jgi:hypothetical protein
MHIREAMHDISAGEYTVRTTDVKPLASGVIGRRPTSGSLQARQVDVSGFNAMM